MTPYYYLVTGVQRAQSAVEYLFMVVAVLILVAIAMSYIIASMREISAVVSNYTAEMREELIENL